MYNYQRFLIVTALFTFIFCGTTLSRADSGAGQPLVTQKVTSIAKRVAPLLQKEHALKGLQYGSPVFIRIFKLPSELEVWIDNNGQYELFKTYTICDFSGFPGPKLHEGDWQSPEGFYSVTADQMNPLSNYHLSFDIGYPNEYDRIHKRDGGNIMVHGSCSSMGCFAMGDYRIEEIYTLVQEALKNGQKKVDVHIFPFRMTNENMQKFSNSPWIGFWKNLKEGFDEFEQNRRVPAIEVANDRYIIRNISKLAQLSSAN